MTPSFWLELFIRSAVLLGMAEGLRRLSKRQAASFRHKLLLCVFGLLAVLPLLSAILPSITLPVGTVPPVPQSSIAIRQVAVSSAATAAHPGEWLFSIWLAGVLAALTPMLAGSYAVWRIAYRSQRLSDELFLSPELSVPLTCGLFRRRIVLPAAAKGWPPSRISAVLAHERAHIRRRDLAAQTAARLLAALWWFQPLVWLACRRLRAESELACDAEALQSGLRPSQYAAELLAVARSIKPGPRLSAFSISMARSCDLENRLRAILDPAPAALSRPRRYALALALGTAAIVSSASNLNKGGSTMKRTFASALLTSAGLSAATLGGSVHDANGRPIADAKVFVYNPDTSATQDAITDTDGRFSIAGTPAGQYILRIEKPGFASILREYDLGGDATLDRTFTMGTKNSSDAESAEAAEKQIRVGGALAQANVIRKVPPVYPASAKADHIEGSVDIDATISKEGIPVELRVVASPRDDLSQSALEAVRQWRYRPALLNRQPTAALNAQPTAVLTRITITYSLAK